MSLLSLPDDHQPTSDPHSRAEVDPLEAVGRFAERDRRKYIALARRRLRQLGVEEATLMPEGAVQEACLRLCQRIKSGEDPPVTTPEDWDDRLIRAVKRVTWEAGRRQRAQKRSAPDRDHNERALLEVPDTRARRPDEHVGAALHVEWLLALLDRKEASLRSIVLMKLEGFTNEEIAGELDLAVKTIEWKLRRIRSLLRRHLQEDE
jgi:RNA polymerase sigma factor (sigma-70 family)